MNVDNLLASQHFPESSESYETKKWKESLKLISIKIGDSATESWFRLARIKSVKGRTVTIAVANTIIQQFISSNFINPLSDSLSEALGRNDLKIIFDIDNSILPPEEKDPSGKCPVPVDDDSIVEKISRGRQSEKDTRRRPDLPDLNPSYTFENFISGDSNRMAYASSLAVAEHPGGTNFNPLVIYGGTGLGKTHLLNAIGNFAKDNETVHRIKYISAQEFLIRYVDFVLKKRKSSEFYNEYRNIDLLLLDDIHILADKDRTQEEFYKIFNHLMNMKKQIVITCDRPPEKIRGMHETLLSRFSGGLTVDIKLPSFETRMAILKTKAESDGVELPGDVLEFIAEHCTSHIRELEGILNRIIAITTILGTNITIENIREMLGELVPAKDNRLTLDKIIKTVASEFDISETKIKAASRCKNVIIPRQICMYLARNYTHCALETIGLYFGKNHSTVIHSSRKAEALIDQDSQIKAKLESVKKTLSI
ncbi:MAG: chromosomal replication initiator protein DnaA [Fibrobacterota bacterium]